MGSTASTLAASSSTIETNTITIATSTTSTYGDIEEMENTSNENSNQNVVLNKIIDEKEISVIEMNESKDADTIDNNSSNKCKNVITVNDKSKSASGKTHATDDGWWWQIENENLILDQVLPRATTATASAKAKATATATATPECREASFLNVENPANKLGSECVGYTLISGKTEQTLKNNGKVTEGIAECTDNYGAVGGTNEKSDIAARETTLEEFKEELRLKRLSRQTAVQDLRDEISSLRKQLAQQKSSPEKTMPACQKMQDCEKKPRIEENSDQQTGYYNGRNDGVDTDDEDPMSRSRHANIELANAQLALQLSTAENLTLRTEIGVIQKQVGTLKEVVSCCKQMLSVKEEQCTQLKKKLTEIESSLAERELNIMSSNLRAEYERQLGNIRQLRELYEERQRISAAEHENLQRLISIKRDELHAEQEKTKIIEERNQTLMKEVETTNNELATLREECNEHKFEKKAIKDEMEAVNTLFSQMVMGFNGKNNLDIDRLTMMLEENRTLLNDMATKEVANCSDGATLPKLLFELVEQAAVAANANKNTSRCVSPVLSAAEIEENVRSVEDEHDVEAVDNVAAGDANGNVDTKTNIDEVAAISRGVATAHVSNHEDGELSISTMAAGANDATLICYGTSEELQQQQQHQQSQPQQQDAIVTNQVTASLQAVEPTVTTTTTTTTSATTMPSITTSTSGMGVAAILPKCEKKHHRSIATTTTTTTTKSNAMTTADALATTTKKPTTTSSKLSTKTIEFPEAEVIGKVVSTQEIIGNLPKVWKVLMELLSHHKIERVQFEENGAGEDCYKSVETPTGIKTELSVSKTYIKLKDLILEKKSLVKETNRLKTLNCHLEYRLNEQEKRLSTVSLELTKTWHLVGKMQRQHRQLHTQEQILRYQLQQKRRLLSELKDELEYCRRKWAAARAKNDESQEQCNDLRREFAKRKLEDANNSTESGYSDSSPASDEEERTAGSSLAVTDGTVPVTVAGGCRRKILKEMFEHTRKIKRMQSTSPGRAAYNITNNAGEFKYIGLLRCNSAPPTCGWQGCDGDTDDDEDLTEIPTTSKGAIPKAVAARIKRESVEADVNVDTLQPEEQACRIQRLEEQCQNLIQQVLETSDNRELLEIQLCRFQDEISPAQFAVALDKLVHYKRVDRMTRASSAPASGCLTPREEEYTRKRSERLGRLEEESKQLMSRIKRTTDRGHYLRCSLDRFRRVPSREGSFESNTEEDLSLKVEVDEQEDKPVSETEENEKNAVTEANEDVDKPTTRGVLTRNEEAYIARRSARLQRLEEESRALLSRISRNTARGGRLDSRLDALHDRYGSSDEAAAQAQNEPNVSESVEKRIEDINTVSKNRAERLKILEEEGKDLLKRLSNTSARGTEMINRIAEREQRKQRVQTSAIASESSNVTPSEIAVNLDIEEGTLLSEGNSQVVIPSILNNVACSSISVNELSDSVTSTQVARQQGALPKTSKPTAQLCFARLKATKTKSNSSTESLEDMVKRLKEIPLPESERAKSENEKDISSGISEEEKVDKDNAEQNESDAAK